MKAGSISRAAYGLLLVAATLCCLSLAEAKDFAFQEVRLRTAIGRDVPLRFALEPPASTWKPTSAKGDLRKFESDIYELSVRENEHVATRGCRR